MAPPDGQFCIQFAVRDTGMGVPPDKQVLLDVWEVSAFAGEPHGAEGQPLAWVAPGRLGDYQFPAANAPIVAAARLPERYEASVTGRYFDEEGTPQRRPTLAVVEVLIADLASRMSPGGFRKALYTGKLLGHLVTLKHGEETQPVIAKAIDEMDQVLGVIGLRRAEDAKPPVPVEEIERLVISVRADTAAFSRDVSTMRAELEGPLVAGVGRDPLVTRGLVRPLPLHPQGRLAPQPGPGWTPAAVAPNLGSADQSPRPALRIEGGSLQGGSATLDAGESSQYLSAILMAGSASAQDSLPIGEARAVRPDRAAVPFGVGGADGAACGARCAKRVQRR